MITHGKLNGKETRVITQKYIVGLYVAVYTKGEAVPDQFGVDVAEDSFHRDIRAGKVFRGVFEVNEALSTKLEEVKQ